MEQVVILLLIALISLVNWLVKKSSELREARKREQGAAEGGGSLRSEPPQLPEAEHEISMRRLSEALGLPEEAEPPVLPKRMERQVPPPRATPPPPLPPPRPSPLARPVISHVPLAPAHEEYRFIELPHTISKPARPRIEVAPSSSRIRELLGSAGGLRDAVVLSEILGPPKSLRPTQGQLLK
jgi:hypothetical protein